MERRGKQKRMEENLVKKVWCARLLDIGFGMNDYFDWKGFICVFVFAFYCFWLTRIHVSCVM